MIGNDIVDLEVAKFNSRWKEQRFLDKLFTAEEQNIILSDGSRFENIWRLWSMKEGTYKIISRAEDKICFNPRDYKCSLINKVEGRVSYGHSSISTLTEATQEFTRTTAFYNRNWTSEVFRFLHSDVQSQHLETNQYAIKRYAELKHISQDTIEIRKNSIGVPQFYIEGILQKECLSLTHHGGFGAFAIAV